MFITTFDIFTILKFEHSTFFCHEVFFNTFHTMKSRLVIYMIMVPEILKPTGHLTLYIYI